MTAEQHGTGAVRRPRRPAHGAATIEDVAQAAGVSRQTVTRAMNDMPGISTATKERVLRAAKDLHYRPSRFGRGLARAAHDTLGLVVSDLTNPYYPEFAAATVRYAGRLGWNVVLVDTVHAPDPGLVLADLAHQVDAVVGYVGRHEVWADALAGMPVVSVDPPADGGTPAGTATVALDPGPALHEAARHLLASGTRTVAVLDGSRAGPTDRAQLIEQVLTAAGLRVDVLPAGGQDVVAGRTATARLVADGLPDAVVGWNDIVAVGALSVLHEAGIAVPGRVRVLGIDGLTLGTFVTPQLSTLAVDMAGVARAAVDLALQALDPAGGGAGHRRVRHDFLARGSS